ncbi:MAG: hypothetical protein SVT56_11565, partial [Chloroflexota bacterium]|nr:hypothetical protein [Chloroflexota bacterium]
PYLSLRPDNLLRRSFRILYPFFEDSFYLTHLLILACHGFRLYLSSLVIVKRSPQYRLVHPWLLSIHPSDGWKEKNFVFFLFSLSPGASMSSETVGSFVLFVVQIDNDKTKLTAVKLISPDITGTEAIVEDLMIQNRLSKNSVKMR